MLLLRPRRSIPSDPSLPHTRPIHTPPNQLPNPAPTLQKEEPDTCVSDQGTGEADAPMPARQGRLRRRRNWARPLDGIQHTAILAQCLYQLDVHSPRHVKLTHT